MRTGRGLSPVQTLLRLVTGDGVGDWVGDVMGLFSWVLAWGRESVKTAPVLVTGPTPVSSPRNEPAPSPSPSRQHGCRGPFSPARLLPKDELPSSQSSQYLSTGVWVVQVSWLLPPLVQAVVLTVAPLHHRGILGGLGAIGYVQLHHNHARA